MGVPTVLRYVTQRSPLPTASPPQSPPSKPSCHATRTATPSTENEYSGALASSSDKNAGGHCVWLGLLFAAISMVIIVVDFITKKWMLSLLFEIPQQIVITSFFNLTPVWNKGVSFGIMSSHPEIIRFIIPVFALLVILYLISQIHLQQRMQQIGSAIIAGGAAGNVIDRFLYGKVVDFFDFHIGGYHWPAFNIADIAICAGVAIMIYVIIWPSSKLGEE